MKTLKKTGVWALSLCLLLNATPQPVNAGTIKLNKTQVTLYSGNKTTLKVTGTTKHIMWTTSDKKIATVNSKGVVYGKKSGEATITARVGSGSSGKSLKCKIKVKNKLVIPKTRVFVTLGEYEEIIVKDRGLKSEEYITFFDNEDGTVNFEWDENPSNPYNIIIAEGRNLGCSSITLGITDYFGVEIGTEKHTIDVYVLRDQSGWISWNDLKYFADIEKFSDEDGTEYSIDSSKDVSDSGIVNSSLSFILPSDAVNNTVYSAKTYKNDTVRYKLVDKRLYFNVNDLISANLI